VRAVDTNVLVRLVTRDDPKQVAAAEAFVAPGAWVPQLAIARAVEMLLQHEHLTLQDPEVVAAAVSQFRRKPAVGFSDCLMVEVTRKAGHGPLGTFDRDLARIDGAHRL
jgi:predicted nucleic acid-binding protein